MGAFPKPHSDFQSVGIVMINLQLRKFPLSKRNTTGFSSPLHWITKRYIILDRGFKRQRPSMEDTATSSHLVRYGFLPIIKSGIHSTYTCLLNFLNEKNELLNSKNPHHVSIITSSLVNGFTSMVHMDFYHHKMMNILQN